VCNLEGLKCVLELLAKNEKEKNPFCSDLLQSSSVAYFAFVKQLDLKI